MFISVFYIKNSVKQLKQFILFWNGWCMRAVWDTGDDLKGALLVWRACHTGRLESSLVLTSILWMGASVSWWQINMGTPAWIWSPRCHICHKANQEVIGQDTGRKSVFFLWRDPCIHLSTHASFSICCCRKLLACLHADSSSTVFLIQWLAYIHTQELCSPIRLSSSATEQLHQGRWCFSKPSSKKFF